MSVTSGISTGLQALWKARLESLISEFQHYYTITRMSPIKGGLRTFIRGLILSSSVIDEIRQDLPSSYSISWGQVMDAKGFLSKEMDAIIYSGRPYKRWENIGYAIVPKEM